RLAFSVACPPPSSGRATTHAAGRRQRPHRRALRAGVRAFLRRGGQRRIDGAQQPQRPSRQRRERTKMKTAVLATALLGGVGCAHVPPLCPAVPGNPGTNTFGTLLLYGYDPHTRALPRPTLDCTGTPVLAQAQEAERCDDNGDAETETPHALPAKELASAAV